MWEVALPSMKLFVVWRWRGQKRKEGVSISDNVEEDFQISPKVIRIAKRRCESRRRSG